MFLMLVLHFTVPTILFKRYTIHNSAHIICYGQTPKRTAGKDIIQKHKASVKPPINQGTIER